MIRRSLLFVVSLLIYYSGAAQITWENRDSLYQPLPSSVHIYTTSQPIDTGVFRAWYLVADLHDKSLEFTTDTSFRRRLTPADFYKKNNQALVIVNGPFFSYETNLNLNLVIKDGQLIAQNIHSMAGRGKDTFTYRHVVGGALGIYKNRTADVAWIFTDSSKKRGYAFQSPVPVIKDSNAKVNWKRYVKDGYSMYQHSLNIPAARKWKVKTAIGGGPVLLQNGMISISNNEELRFAGKAINDKHPRTSIGYTADGKLIILVIEGRSAVSHGATLVQEAQLLKDLGCVEALNLDGGGSSCLLLNGKETNHPSDNKQRQVPGVFVIKDK
jgi:exopolysaccharide biosynthesis protein